MLWYIVVNKQLKSLNRKFIINIELQSAAQRIVLYGPSGSGKTQLLRMISGLVKPDSGLIKFQQQVLFDSCKKIDLPPQQRSIGYVFQDYALFPHLTVLQNIAFSLNKSWFNKRKDFSSSEIELWLDKLEIRHLINQYPQQLSGGQAQRVAIARSLVGKPQALLLDEPFAAVDEKLRKSLRQQLLELQQQINLPMILISHNTDDIEYFAEEVLEINQGRLMK